MWSFLSDATPQEFGSGANLPEQDQHPEQNRHQTAVEERSHVGEAGAGQFHAEDFGRRRGGGRHLLGQHLGSGRGRGGRRLRGGGRGRNRGGRRGRRRGGGRRRRRRRRRRGAAHDRLVHPGVLRVLVVGRVDVA